jgi:hypothetical protein
VAKAVGTCTGVASSAEGPPPGLDAARHAAGQRAAHQAEVLRESVFAASMAAALAHDKLFDPASYQVYLQRLMADSGDPPDPVERMMLEQLALAHFRVAALHVRAGRAEGLEATKILSAAAARLLGEFRRTALAFKVYRSGAPAVAPRAKIKLFKAAL